MDTSDALDTTRFEAAESRPFTFGLPPREYLSGESLDRFLAKCYIRIEQWAVEIPLETGKETEDPSLSVTGEGSSCDML